MEKKRLIELLSKDFVNLTYMKFHGGHTIERHIYLSDDNIENIKLKNNKQSLSKYNSRQEAETCFREVIDSNIDLIVDWFCDTNDEYLVVLVNHNRNVGTEILDGNKFELSWSRAKFVRLDDSNNSVLGFYLQTMFPTTPINLDY